MWHRVDLVWTDISEEHIASIFRVQKSVSEEPVLAGGCRLSYQLKTPLYQLYMKRIKLLVMQCTLKLHSERAIYNPMSDSWWISVYIIQNFLFVLQIVSAAASMCWWHELTYTSVYCLKHMPCWVAFYLNIDAGILSMQFQQISHNTGHKMHTWLLHIS
jgi:hypothetical protein